MKSFICIMLVSLALSSAHKAFESGETSFNEMIQRFADGLAEAAGKPQADLSLCFSPSTSEQALLLLEDIFSEVSEKNMANIPLLVSIYQTYAGQIWECLNQNFEFVRILEGLNVKNVPLDQLFLEFTEYALKGNYDQLVEKAKEIHENFEEGEFEKAGNLTGELLKTIVQSHKSNSMSGFLNLNAFARSAALLERALTERKGTFKN